MNSTIWKYPVQLGDFSLAMPVGAKVLAVQPQGNAVCMWAEVNSDPDARTETRCFFIVGTGWEMAPHHRRYIATFQTQGGAFVWHLFEVNPEEKE